MNRQTKKISFLSLLLIAVLIAAIISTMISCDNGTTNTPETTGAESTEESQGTTEAETEALLKFTFEVVFANKSTKTYNIQTDKKTVGEALIAEGLIAGEDSQYGLYVKTVDGETHDYATDGKYWAFYVNGKMASVGVDSTDVVDGATYSFKAE